jgi:hypothetical protein
LPLPPGCTGVAKPGVDQVVAIAGTSLAGFIEHYLGSRAIPFAAALGYVSFQMPAFCATGPPAFYQLTVGDYANLTLESLGIPSPDPGVLDKLLQVLQYYAWYDLCQCSNIATPPPTVAVEPPGAPAPNDTQGPPPAGACIDLTRGVNNRDATYVDPIAGDPRNVQNLTPSFFNSATLITVPDTILTGSPNVVALKLPTPLPVSIQAVMSDVQVPSGTCVQNVYMRVFNAAGTATRPYVGLHSASAAGVPSSPLTQPFVAGDDHIVLYSELSQICTGGGFQLHVTLNCVSGNPIVTPCCPPDEYSNTLLVNILNKVTNINTAGSSAPTSWRDGTRHNTLSGSGRLVLSSSAVGVRAEVSSIPAGIDTHPGNPAFYFDLGFITPIALDVPLRGQRLVFNPQSFALPQFADGIAWTLPAGAVINLVELLPVP